MIALRTYSGGYERERSLRIWGDGSCKSKSRGLQLQDTYLGPWRVSLRQLDRIVGCRMVWHALAGFRLVSRQSGRLR
jgi:hypothetical protein